MTPITGRYFLEYDLIRQRLHVQRQLIESLETAGYEKVQSRILTARYGVPITAFLLLLKDSIDNLRTLDADLIARRQELGSIPHQNVLNDYGLGLKAGTGSDSMTGYDWKRERIVGLDQPLALSGVCCASHIEIIVPKSPRGTPLRNIYETPREGVLIMSEVIKVGGGDTVDVPLIGHLKATMLTLELFYCVQQRVEVEVKSFRQHVGADPGSSKFDSMFLSQCTRRGSLIHEGELAIGVARTGELTLADKPVVAMFDGAFNEGVAGVDDVYSRMLRAIPSAP